MKKLGNNLGKMIKGTRRFSNVHTAFVNFYKNDFLVCAQQGFSVAENYVRYYPMSKFHKGMYLWEANSHLFTLTSHFSDGGGGTEINPGTAGLYQVTGIASKQS